MSGPRRILLIQLGDIGDVVLSQPCMAALRAAYPQSWLTVAVRAKATDLLRLFPQVNESVAVADQGPFWRNLPGQLTLLARLRRQQFDLAVDLRTGERGAILALASGARRRIGFHAADGPSWRNRLFTDLHPDDYRPDRHVTRHLLDLLVRSGIPAVEPIPRLSVPSGSAQEVADLLTQEGIDRKGAPLAALHFFSLWPYKELPAEKCVAIIGHLRHNYDYTVLLVGGPGDRPRAAALQQRCGNGVYNLAGRTSLAQYAALLQRCQILIGIDSVGQHLAAAVGTPTITIYGPSHPASWAPQGARHLVVQPDLPCVPCRQTGCDGKGRSRCLQEIHTNTILAALDRHLATITASWTANKNVSSSA